MKGESARVSDGEVEGEREGYNVATWTTHARCTCSTTHALSAPTGMHSVHAWVHTALCAVQGPWAPSLEVRGRKTTACTTACPACPMSLPRYSTTICLTQPRLHRRSSQREPRGKSTRTATGRTCPLPTRTQAEVKSILKRGVKSSPIQAAPRRTTPVTSVRARGELDFLTPPRASSHFLSMSSQQQPPGRYVGARLGRGRGILGEGEGEG